MKTSPGWMASTGNACNIERIAPSSEPRCSGICVPCATSRPAASNRATEQSLRSLILVEKDARTSVLFMSSVIDSSRLLNTSMPIGSAMAALAECSVMQVSLQADQQVAVGVDRDAVTRPHDRGRTHFLDQGRPAQAGAGRQQVAVVHRGVAPAMARAEIGAPLAQPGIGRQL